MEQELAALQFKYSKVVEEREFLKTQMDEADFQLKKYEGDNPGLSELGRHELNDLYDQMKKAYWRVKTARSEAREREKKRPLR